MKNKAKKTRMGRPPLPKNLLKAKMLPIRITETEWKRLQTEAAHRGVTVANLLMGPYRVGDR